LDGDDGRGMVLDGRSVVFVVEIWREQDSQLGQLGLVSLRYSFPGCPKSRYTREVQGCVYLHHGIKIAHREAVLLFSCKKKYILKKGNIYLCHFYEALNDSRSLFRVGG